MFSDISKQISSIKCDFCFTSFGFELLSGGVSVVSFRNESEVKVEQRPGILDLDLTRFSLWISRISPKLFDFTLRVSGYLFNVTFISSSRRNSIGKSSTSPLSSCWICRLSFPAFWLQVSKNQGRVPSPPRLPPANFYKKTKEGN